MRFLKLKLWHKNHLWPTLLGLEHRPIKTILDVGAYDGDTASIFRRYFPEATIYCFEPQPESFKKLQAWANQQKGLVVPYNFAIGDRTGKAQLMINTVAPRTSSIISLINYETRPEDLTPTEIKIFRLDDLADKIQLEDEVLIKIDTEGFEKQVVHGAFQVMKKAVACIIESHVCPRFVKQTLFFEIIQIMSDHGFTYAGNIHQGRRKNGMVGHFDAIFVKDNILINQPATI